MLATIVIKSKIATWENDTISATRVQTEGKGKDQPAEPDSQESWQKLADQTNNAGDRLQGKSLKISFLSVLSRRCDFVGECFCKIWASFMLDRVLLKQGLPVEDCAFF